MGRGKGEGRGGGVHLTHFVGVTLAALNILVGGRQREYPPILVHTLNLKSSLQNNIVTP